MQRARERACRIVRVREHLENSADRPASFVLGKTVPRWPAPREDSRGVKLEIMRIRDTEGLRQLVGLRRDPVRLGFEDGNPAEDELFLFGVARGARIVEAEKVHAGRNNAAEWGSTQRTALAAR